MRGGAREMVLTEPRHGVIVFDNKTVIRKRSIDLLGTVCLYTQIDPIAV
jgi:hypothetical protein